MLTLAVLDAEHAEPGTEVPFVWGEAGGGSAKPTVEPHVRTQIRAVVSRVPYVEAVRRSYAPNLRAGALRFVLGRRATMGGDSVPAP
ncbi:MAG TPA: hypothetical protein VIK04_14560 [Solirubrobacteraceae bacterium]